jgi:hypothetical protein
MHYELWDTSTGNLLGEYDSEGEALAVVRNALRLHGLSATQSLALALEHDEEAVGDDDLPPVLAGPKLLARAKALEKTAGRRVSA